MDRSQQRTLLETNKKTYECLLWSIS